MPQTKESFLKSRSTKVLLTAYQESKYTYNWYEEENCMPCANKSVCLQDKLDRFFYTIEEIKTELDHRPHLPNKKERQEKLAKLKPKKHIGNHSSRGASTSKFFRKYCVITIHSKAENETTYGLVDTRGQWPYFSRISRHNLWDFCENINNERRLTINAKCSISGTNEKDLKITISPDNHSPINSSFVSRCRSHFLNSRLVKSK